MFAPLAALSYTKSKTLANNGISVHFLNFEPRSKGDDNSLKTLQSTNCPAVPKSHNSRIISSVPCSLIKNPKELEDILSLSRPHPPPPTKSTTLAHGSLLILYR